MTKSLYLLRKPPGHISAAVFVPDAPDSEFVLLGEAASAPLALEKGRVFTIAGDGSSSTAVTYEDLVEKIFQHDHVTVI
jgi:hypothetical protein